MFLVLDNEINPEYRFLGPEIVNHLTRAEYHVVPDEPTLPDYREYDGIVLSGSTASVYDDTHREWLAGEIDLVEACIDERVPLLGICFGHQLVHHVTGGVVEPDRRRATFVELHEYDPTANGLLSGIDPPVPVLHADVVVEPGTDMHSIASTEYSSHFCSKHAEAPLWTVQFHPEFTAAVSDRASDFAPGRFSFAESNAVDVLDRYEALTTDPDVA
jgi:GMP synthase (glutamine-hydrolysing)